MKYWLLPQCGNDYKANLHCHTNLSDGALSPQQVKDLYMQKGYSVVAFTDHDVFIPHPELNDQNFLALNGFEAEINEPKNEAYENIKSVHMNFIALNKNIVNQPCWHRSLYQFGGACGSKNQVKYDSAKPDFVREYSAKCVNEFMKECKKCGFFAVYNHPAWSLHDYTDWSDYSEMDALEILNGGSIREGFCDESHIVYDGLLRQGKKLYAVAGDDNHQTYDTGLAYTVIRAKNLCYEDIASALQNGSFYASQGPKIKELYVRDNRVYITCSPAQKITFNTGIRHAGAAYPKEGENTITQASFEVLHHDKYFRLTVTAPDGKMAYTNAYYPQDYNINA